MLPSNNKSKLLCDENIPVELIKQLKDDGFDVKRVILRSDDKDITDLAKSEKRVLLTFDRHFINKNKYPPSEYEGIVFISIHPPLIDSLHFSLDKLFKIIDSSNFKGKLFTLTNFGYKVFPRSKFPA